MIAVGTSINIPLIGFTETHDKLIFRSAKTAASDYLVKMLNRVFLRCSG